MVELRRGAGRPQDAGYRRRRSEVSLNIAVRGARAAEDGEAVSDVVFHAEQAAVVVDIGVFPGLSDIAAAIRSFGKRHSRARDEWPGRRVFRRGHNSNYVTELSSTETLGRETAWESPSAAILDLDRKILSNESV